MVPELGEEYFLGVDQDNEWRSRDELVQPRGGVERLVRSELYPRPRFGVNASLEFVGGHFCSGRWQGEEKPMVIYHTWTHRSSCLIVAT